MRLIIILISISLTTTIFAQKKPLIESREEVETLAKKEFDL